MTAEELVQAIVAGIVPRPELVTVRAEPVTGGVVIVVEGPGQQVRFAIGRHGATADAIRAVLAAWSGLNRQAAYLKVIESDPKERESERVRAEVAR